MATKLDITLAARAARHLYMTTAVLFGLVFFTCFLVFVVSIDPHSSPPPLLRSIKEYNILFVLLCAGFLFLLYKARRELTGWAYLITGVGSVLLLIALFFVVEPNVWIYWFLCLIYLMRVLIDYGRLAFTRYGALATTPLRLADAVSRLLRTIQNPVRSIHKPTDPYHTAGYAVLAACCWFLGAHVKFDFWVMSLVPVTFFGIMARRHYVYRATELLALDDRPPILFLRSFGDDKGQLWGRGVLGKFRKKTIDEAISWFARRLGPFIAIANPNTKLPRLGSAQSYYTNETWQDAIARWAEMAQFIVIVAGRTEGIRWELDHIFSTDQQHKIIIFFPPAMRSDQSTIYRWLTDHFSHTRYIGGLLRLDERTIAIAFERDDVFVIESKQDHKYEVDYLIAFQAMIFAKKCAVH